MKTSLLDRLEFKDYHHEYKFLAYYEILTIEQNKQIDDDCYYLSLIYLLSLVNKDLNDYFTLDGFNGMKLIEDSAGYSSSERFIINLALHLFNNLYEHAAIDDIFSYLDSKNQLIVLNALKLRYFKG